MQETFATIIGHALPGTRVTSMQQLGTRTYALAISDGQRVVLRLGDVAGEAAALRLLASEIDLPVPTLVAVDVDGTVGGQPWLLRSFLEGVPLVSAIDAIDEQERYALGRRLGEIAVRVHAITCERYGVLAGSDPYAATRDDLAYISLRAEAAIHAAETARTADGAPLLDDALATELRDWFSQQYDPSGRQATLVHGDFHPAYVLVRERKQREGGRLQISGVLGWENALGWAPGWDHVCLLEAAGTASYFGFRVGYGESYDDATQRAASQVREYALVPYRLVMHLEELVVASASEQGRHLRTLAALLRISAKMHERDATEE